MHKLLQKQLEDERQQLNEMHKDHLVKQQTAQHKLRQDREQLRQQQEQLRRGTFNTA